MNQGSFCAQRVYGFPDSWHLFPFDVCGTRAISGSAASMIEVIELGAPAGDGAAGLRGCGALDVVVRGRPGSD